MRNRMYGGVRGRKTKVGEKLLRFPPTRFTFFEVFVLLGLIVLGLFVRSCTKCEDSLTRKK